MRVRAAALALVVTLSWVPPAHGARFYVDGNPGSAGDDRRSVQVAQNSETPFKTIAHALEVAHLVTQGRPHVIEIAAGTYSPSSGETFPLVVTEPEIYLEHDDTAEMVFDAEGESGIFRVLAASDDFVVQDFTLINGSADKGGVLYSEGGTIRMVDNEFSDNRATDGGQVVYVEDGRLRFYNNVVTENGLDGDTAPLIEIHNVVGDAEEGDDIRNNTFYMNPAPAILTSGNKTAINSNIFLETGVPVIRSTAADSVFATYNLFWETDILYVPAEGDSIKLARSVRDTTVTVIVYPEPDPRPPPTVPNILLTVPDTIAVVDENYQYTLEVASNRAFHQFIPVLLPPGASLIAAAAEVDPGLISWTPTLADTGRHEVNVRVISPFGVESTLDYFVHAFEVFPDTSAPPPAPPPDTIVTVTVDLVPDTTGAIQDLSRIVPDFSGASTALGNLFADPLMIDPAIGRFELTNASPGRDGGDPDANLLDGTADPNDMGDTGGPTNPGAAAAGNLGDLLITSLPDSVAIQDQDFVYDPTIEPTTSLLTIDLISGPPTMFDVFGARPPITWVPTIADTGSHLVHIVTFSLAGKRGRQIFPLVVKPANERPRISSNAVIFAFEDQTYSYQILANDANGDTITYSKVTGPDGLTVDAESGLVQWSPVQDDLGTVAVEILLEDGKGESTRHAYTLNVLNTNDPPALAIISDSTAVEDAAFAFAVSGSDPDPEDTLEYSLTTAPEGMTITQEGVISWVPVEADIGDYVITVQVADGEAATASRTFSLTVAGVNDPPVITSAPGTTILEDATYLYAVVAEDEEEEELAYSLAAAPQGMSIGADGVVSWVPDNPDVGVHTIEIAVEDPAGNRVLQQFNLTVQDVNDLPTITARSPEGELVIATPEIETVLFVEAEDEEGIVLAFSWTRNGVAIEGADESALTVIPNDTEVDTYELAVSDQEGIVTASWVVDARQIPRILLIPDVADFGGTSIGATSQVLVEVRNDGSSNLEISALVVGNLQFSAIFGTGIIGPGASTNLELRFSPGVRGTTEGTIGFDTNDPDNPQVEVALTGVGIVPTQVALDLDPAPESQALAETEAGAGEAVQVALYVVDALDLVGFELTIAFDPESLSFVDFAAGTSDEDNLLSDPGTALLPGSVLVGEGQLRVSVTTQEGATGVSGSGLLGVVTFVTDEEFVDGATTDLQPVTALLQSAGDVAADVLAPGALASLTAKPSLTGDFDGSGFVDIFDFFLFVDNFGTTNPTYDLDASGAVDFFDLFIFVDNFGTSSEGPSAKSVGRRLLSDSRRSYEKPSGVFSLVPVGATASDVQAELHWQGGDLRGYALTASYDPRVLSPTGFAPSAGLSQVQWWDGDVPGQLLVAVASPPDLSPLADGRLGVFAFERHGTQSTGLSVDEAVVYSGGRVERIEGPPEVNLRQVPEDFALLPARPNPFNPETVITVYLPKTSRLELRIFDALGRPVKVLTDEQFTAGFHEFIWPGFDETGRTVASGMYFVDFRAGSVRRVEKLMLLK